MRNRNEIDDFFTEIKIIKSKIGACLRDAKLYAKLANKFKGVDEKQVNFYRNRFNESVRKMEQLTEDFNQKLKYRIADMSRKLEKLDNCSTCGAETQPVKKSEIDRLLKDAINTPPLTLKELKNKLKKEREEKELTKQRPELRS